MKPVHNTQSCKEESAMKTLVSLGYTYQGGETWVPETPTTDAKWMHSQLTKLAAHPHICLCSLSEEFEVIDKAACEVCDKNTARAPQPKSLENKGEPNRCQAENEHLRLIMEKEIEPVMKNVVLLRQENEKLHDLVAAQADEIHSLKDDARRKMVCTLNFNLDPTSDEVRTLVAGMQASGAIISEPLPEQNFSLFENFSAIATRRVMHWKNQHPYNVFTEDARMNIAHPRLVWDGARMTIYRDDHGKWHVRASEEFNDGRFLTLGHDSSTPEYFRALPILHLRQIEATALAASIWGNDTVYNRAERIRRMAEEFFELLQAVDLDHEMGVAIWNEVWSRPKGEPWQEVGGALFTIRSFCQTFGFNAEQCEVDEINRVRRKDPDDLRRRHAIKAALGLATPATPPTGLPDDPKPAAKEPATTYQPTPSDFIPTEQMREYVKPKSVVSVLIPEGPIAVQPVPECGTACGTKSRCLRLGCGVREGRKNRSEDQHEPNHNAYLSSRQTQD